ncbi:response regulator transcription factor [Gabonibacter massiliensis]|uniref:response regulator transcription factor n=1 Tax=Gabonibacter massiliensis TaxID=1720195 RepID=UPI00073E370B|nr:response regulator transcription factor [Gabonibacter massiliensis]
MKILIIEDEENLREVMTKSLEKERFVVEQAPDYHSALLKINDYDYDCILLDIMLPDGNGLTLLEELKKNKKRESVIIISAKDSIEDKVSGLDLGADDYLAKPFHLAELNARVKSVIRRNQQDGNIGIELANLNVYPDRHTVQVNGSELTLNRKEFDLLYYFVTNPDRLINKTTLAESVWGDRIDQADSLDFIYSQVKNLRKKMKHAGAIPEIKAIYGFGYKLTTHPEEL